MSDRTIRRGELCDLCNSDRAVSCGLPQLRTAGVARPVLGCTRVITLVSKLPLAESFEPAYLEYYGILPLEIDSDRLRVASDRQPAAEVLEDLEQCFGVAVELVQTSQEELFEGIRRTFAASESVLELVKDLDAEFSPAADGIEDRLADARDLANQPPVIRFVNLLIREAHDARASDIHLESTREGLSARFRVDGVLTELPSPPKGLQAAVVSRIKLLAELDRTGASACGLRSASSIYGCRPCRRSTANRSCSACSIAAVARWGSTSWAWRPRRSTPSVGSPRSLTEFSLRPGRRGAARRPRCTPPSPYAIGLPKKSSPSKTRSNTI
ncbi:MAG: hypothetical protein DMD25_13760 [Gemmatimonadetes bacterium]|nr:MAG: hypothetical protein DMD25_13760 [Gemmatimonadota bacterium]